MHARLEMIKKRFNHQVGDAAVFMGGVQRSSRKRQLGLAGFAGNWLGLDRFGPGKEASRFKVVYKYVVDPKHFIFNATFSLFLFLRANALFSLYSLFIFSGGEVGDRRWPVAVAGEPSRRSRRAGAQMLCFFVFCFCSFSSTPSPLYFSKPKIPKY